jgi:hypothetical protein
MKTKTFTFFSDPGHAWLKVPLYLLHEFELFDKISTYSYLHNHSAYLEEDLDAFVLIRAFEEKGWKLEFKDEHTDRQSKIRSYERYTADKARNAYHHYTDKRDDEHIHSVYLESHYG